MALKKKMIEITIEDGEMAVDVVCGTGPSCEKAIQEWTALAGGDVVTTKKPEYFKQAKKTENLNIQKK